VFVIGDQTIEVATGRIINVPELAEELVSSPCCGKETLNECPPAVSPERLSVNEAESPSVEVKL
jgi:hypothetical protein